MVERMVVLKADMMVDLMVRKMVDKKVAGRAVLLGSMWVN